MAAGSPPSAGAVNDTVPILPLRNTVYTAEAATVFSPAATVAVKPRLVLRKAPGQRFALTVRTSTSLAGRTVVLEDVRFAVKEGGALAVLGRNGVGKSTLMRTIVGHTTLHGGGIRFAGADVARVQIAFESN